MKIDKKHIVVTGGLGFIGSRFVKKMIEKTPYDVVIIDKMTYAADRNRIDCWLNKERDGGRIKIYAADISDPELDRKTDGYMGTAEYIVNFAAETHVDNSISDGSPFVDSNIKGVFNLLEICKKSEALKKFVQISTDEVYGDMADVPVGELEGATEYFPLKPSSYYSASKASADLLVEACGRTFGIPYLITRTCNNFGPNQHPEKFLPKVIKCIKEGSRVPVYGEGTQVREWIHVDENVEVIYLLMMSEEVNDVFNIGSGIRYRNIDILKMISSKLKVNVQFEHVKDRLGHDKMYKLNCDKAMDKIGVSYIGYTPLFDFLHQELS